MSKGSLLRIVGVVAHFADNSEYFRLGCLTLKKNHLLKTDFYGKRAITC